MTDTDRDLIARMFERVGGLITEVRMSREEMVALRESHADLANLLARVDERSTNGQFTFAEALRRHSERSKALEVRVSAVEDASEQRDDSVLEQVRALQHVESERRGGVKVVALLAAAGGTVIGGVVTALVIKALGG